MPPFRVLYNLLLHRTSHWQTEEGLLALDKLFCWLSTPKPKGNSVLFQQRGGSQLRLRLEFGSFTAVLCPLVCEPSFSSVPPANKLVPLHSITNNYNMSSVLAAN